MKQILGAKCKLKSAVMNYKKKNCKVFTLYLNDQLF